MLAALRYREFQFFWLASAISLIGYQLAFIALPWLVLNLTGDAFAEATLLEGAAGFGISLAGLLLPGIRHLGHRQP